MRDEIRDRITAAREDKLVDLEGMNIADAEISEIIDAIVEEVKGVEVIILDSNLLTDTGATTLAEKLEGISSLEELQIQHNNIGRDGALAIFSLKANNEGLAIAFHGNQITNTDEMLEIEEEAKQHTGGYHL